jgi:hypothetical protein
VGPASGHRAQHGRRAPAHHFRLESASWCACARYAIWSHPATLQVFLLYSRKVLSKIAYAKALFEIAVNLAVAKVAEPANKEIIDGCNKRVLLTSVAKRATPTDLRRRPTLMSVRLIGLMMIIIGIVLSAAMFGVIYLIAHLLGSMIAGPFMLVFSLWPIMFVFAGWLQLLTGVRFTELNHRFNSASTLKKIGLSILFVASSVAFLVVLLKLIG